MTMPKYLWYHTTIRLLMNPFQGRIIHLFSVAVTSNNLKINCSHDGLRHVSKVHVCLQLQQVQYGYQNTGLLEEKPQERIIRCMGNGIQNNGMPASRVVWNHLWSLHCRTHPQGWDGPALSYPISPQKVLLPIQCRKHGITIGVGNIARKKGQVQVSPSV